MNDINYIKTRYRKMFGLDALAVYSNVNYSNNTYLLGSVSIPSNLNILGDAILYSNTTINTKLDCLNNAYINQNLTILSTLNITNNTIISQNITNFGTLTVSGVSHLNNVSTLNLYISNSTNFYDSIISNNLLVSNQSILNNSITINNNLYVSGITIFNNNLTLQSNLQVLNINSNNVSINSNLFVSGTSILNNVTSNSIFVSQNYISNSNNVNNNLLVNNNITTNNIIVNNASYTCNTNLTVSGNTNLNNPNILGTIINQLPEYDNNTLAIQAGVPLWGLYRTGGIIKILIDEPPVISFISPLDSIIYINLGSQYTEPGITIIDNNNESLTPIITGTVDTNTLGTYILSYKVIDSYGNNSNILYRTIIVS